VLEVDDIVQIIYNIIVIYTVCIYTQYKYNFTYSVIYYLPLTIRACSTVK